MRSTRGTTWRSSKDARKRAEDELLESDTKRADADSTRATSPAHRYGNRVRNMFAADVLRRLRGRLGRRPLPHFHRLRVATNRVLATEHKLSHVQSRAARNRATGIGGSMSLIIWLPLVVLIAGIDYLIGKSLIGVVATTANKTMVEIGAVAMAAYVFTVGHKLGHAITEWTTSDPHGHDKQKHRRLTVAAGFVVTYILVMGTLLLGTGAGLARWGLAFVPLAAGSAIQASKPQPAAFHYAVDLVLIKALRLEQRLRTRVASLRVKRFVRVWVRTAMYYAAQGAKQNANEVRWETTHPHPVPTADNLLSHLDTMARLAITPTPHEVRTELDRLDGRLDLAATNGQMAQLELNLWALN